MNIFYIHNYTSIKKKTNPWFFNINTYWSVSWISTSQSEEFGISTHLSNSALNSISVVMALLVHCQQNIFLCTKPVLLEEIIPSVMIKFTLFPYILPVAKIMPYFTFVHCWTMSWMHNFLFSFEFLVVFLLPLSHTVHPFILPLRSYIQFM